MIYIVAGLVLIDTAYIAGLIALIKAFKERGDE